MFSLLHLFFQGFLQCSKLCVPPATPLYSVIWAEIAFKAHHGKVTPCCGERWVKVNVYVSKRFEIDPSEWLRRIIPE